MLLCQSEQRCAMIAPHGFSLIGVLGNLDRPLPLVAALSRKGRDQESNLLLPHGAHLPVPVTCVSGVSRDHGSRAIGVFTPRADARR